MTASSPPSVASSVYDAAPAMADTLCLVISQSGRSPDILAAAQAAASAGALVVAMVNDEASPLAAMAEVVWPLCARPRSAAWRRPSPSSPPWRRHGPADRPVGRATPNCSPRPGRACRGLLLERASGTPWTGAPACPRSTARPAPLCRRPRPRARRRPGGGPEAQGDLRPARRGLQRRRAQPWPQGPGRAGLSGPGASARTTKLPASGVEAIAAACAAQAGRDRCSRPGGARQPASSRPAHGPRGPPGARPDRFQIQSFYRMADALALARGHDPRSPAASGQGHRNPVIVTL